MVIQPMLPYREQLYKRLIERLVDHAATVAQGHGREGLAKGEHMLSGMIQTYFGSRPDLIERYFPEDACEFLGTTKRQEEQSATPAPTPRKRARRKG